MVPRMGKPGEGEADEGGDEPIPLDERRLSMREVSLLSGVSQKTAWNWIDRGVLAVGERAPAGWMFNIFDALALRVMDDLVNRLTGAPSEMAKVARWVCALAREGMRRPDSPHRENTNALVAIGSDGRLMVTTAELRQPGLYYPPKYDDLPNAALRRSHIVIPVSAMLADVILATQALPKRGHASQPEEASHAAPPEG